MKLFYGVDFGGTTVKFGCFGENGSLIRKWKIKTDCSDAGERILPSLEKEITTDYKSRGLALKEVMGIGLALPGTVKDGVLTERCVNLGGWGGFDAGKELSARTKLPVRCLNDANAALLGEQWCGCAQGVQDAVLLTLGTGIGGAVMVNGRIWEGHGGAAGEFGHIRVREGENRVCGCGGHGCLEQYASARGMEYLYEEALLRNAKPFPGADADAKEIFARAKAGEDEALCAVDEMSRLLGRALAAAACLYDPALFVIGGGLSATGDFLLEKIRSAYCNDAFFAVRGTPICLAALGGDAGMYGAARLAAKPDVL